MKDILNLANWNFMRVLRLLMGLWIVVESVMGKQYLFATLGLWFVIQAVMNVGCAACAVPPSNKANNTDIQEVTYEEVK